MKIQHVKISTEKHFLINGTLCQVTIVAMPCWTNHFQAEVTIHCTSSPPLSTAMERFIANSEIDIC